MRSAVLLVAVLLVGSAACAGTPAAQTFPPPTTDPAPGFSVELLDGSTFDLATHVTEDGRPLVLNFWAVWCQPCLDEMPALQAASVQNPDIAFLGLAVDSGVEAARIFARDLSIDYLLAVDVTGAVATDYGIFTLPSTILIDDTGKAVARIYGALDVDLLDEVLAFYF